MIRSSIYPERNRGAWILAQRPPKRGAANPEHPHGVFLERERLASGEIADSGVILLTNKECPWRCLMCDLWKEMLDAPVPPGAIPRQIDRALATWQGVGVRPAQIKVYNSGSFFDPQAIPEDDYSAIARRLSPARNIVVESHPALIGDRALRLRDQLGGSLEVAMGLETAHPEVLEKLNKKFDLSDFARAAEFLRRADIALRAFVLVKPPFLDDGQSIMWAVKSAEFAFSCGAAVVSLIPTRDGNGAMERLQAAGEFSPPSLHTLEEAFDGALALGRARVFVDTWNLERFSPCPECFAARRERLNAMNLTQQIMPRVTCAHAGAHRA